MPRKKLDWPAIRRDYESGELVPRLAMRNNIKAQAIRERAQAEGWGPNPAEERYRAERAAKLERQQKRLAAAGALVAMPQEERAALVERLLKRYLQGTTLHEMAQELGTNRNVLYCVLLGLVDDDVHHGLISQALIARVAQADALLEAATTPAEIGRARELARFARMDLERRRPHLYGQQVRHDVHMPEDWGERLRRAKSRVGVTIDQPAGHLVEQASDPEEQAE